MNVDELIGRPWGEVMQTLTREEDLESIEVEIKSRLEEKRAELLKRLEGIEKRKELAEVKKRGEPLNGSANEWNGGCQLTAINSNDLLQKQKIKRYERGVKYEY